MLEEEGMEGKSGHHKLPASRVHPSQPVPQQPCQTCVASSSIHPNITASPAQAAASAQGYVLACGKYGLFLLLPSCLSFNYKGRQMKGTLKASE